MNTIRKVVSGFGGSRGGVAALVLGFVFASFSGLASAERLKELCDVEGYRPNALIGVGLVVGLNGTGDDGSSPVTRRALSSMMHRLGVTLDETQAKAIKAKNVAVVNVTAQLAAFARAGSATDVLVSSAGTARALTGGTLILTPLKGADGVTYALAQGPLSIGGFSVEGKSGSGVGKNHPTVGRIPGGARIERNAPGTMSGRSEVVLALRTPDFTNATRIVAAINTSMGSRTASVRDPGAVAVTVPKEWNGYVVEMVSVLESIEVIPDAPARIVIDERTGTIVVGAGVRLGPAAIAHGGLTVRVTEQQNASQPNPLSEQGSTVVTNQSDVTVDEEEGRLVFLAGTSSAGDVANALNALGVKPRDLVAIFEALRHAGALRAEIVII